MQRELRSATLLADNTAPLGLTEAQSRKTANNPDVRHLRKICRGLTAEIHKRGYRTLKDAAGTEIGEQKRRADAELNRTLARLHDKTKAKNRRRHFRSTDTNIFNQQYTNDLQPQQSKT